MNVILFFVRWPQLGRVKSRLASTLGEQEALRIHTLLAERCFTHARQCKNCHVIVCGTGASPERFREWLSGANEYWNQPDAGLGDRLQTLFQRAFEEGASTVCAIGSDAPGLEASGIGEAIEGFSEAPVSVLPASDGGYVLIGMARLFPELFQGIDWGTDRVLKQTTKICDDLEIQITIGKTHQDVDYEEDWLKVSEDLDSG